MDADLIGKVLDWAEFVSITERVARTVASDGSPEVVVGILRGGMIPAVLVAHSMGLRDVRAIEVTHTTTDGANAEKTANPTVGNVASLGHLASRDVLIVDDVAGTAVTMATAEELVKNAGAARVRTLVCTVNQLNWQHDHDPGRALTYVGACYRGWVVFPWEKR
ncbi:MAG: phosphoribosyltransferase [Egibacteraceae bacterium]